MNKLDKLLHRVELSHRNTTIYQLWSVKKMTMAAIGRKFKLSRERIRQIVRKLES